MEWWLWVIIAIVVIVILGLASWGIYWLVTRGDKWEDFPAKVTYKTGNAEPYNVKKVDTGTCRLWNTKLLPSLFSCNDTIQLTWYGPTTTIRNINELIMQYDVKDDGPACGKTNRVGFVTNVHNSQYAYFGLVVEGKESNCLDVGNCTDAQIINHNVKLYTDESLYDPNGKITVNNGNVLLFTVKGLDKAAMRASFTFCIDQDTCGLKSTDTQSYDHIYKKEPKVTCPVTIIARK